MHPIHKTHNSCQEQSPDAIGISTATQKENNRAIYLTSSYAILLTKQEV